MNTDLAEVKEPIAIVGIAAELPSGACADTNLDYRQFNKFLLDGAESYVRFPRDRLNIDSWQGEGLGRIATAHGSFLKDVDLFDHVEFGISTKDARAMSLSTRKLIELSFLALLDSGIDYQGRNVGCYASATNHDILSIAEPDVYEAQGSFGGIPCMVANKVSYHLDLRGPSIPVDTACSSSLTATHLAVQALRAGECESAVVAACQLNLRLADFVQYSQGSVLARDGKCKPFDASADGFSRGEGAVAIVLKPLSAALRDGDHIYANILGTGLSSSGSLAPVYAPVASAQLEAMRRAYIGTGRDPREADYVELHATGTAVGDPIECNWVGEHFARDAELLVGSVKGNIGHLEITAFLASLCKVCGLFETGVLPPNVNLAARNPAIRWDAYKLHVPLEPMVLRARDDPRKLLVSMCSSGIGGANGHAVLESAPPMPAASACRSALLDAPRLLMAGGLSPSSAAGVTSSLLDLARENPDRLPAIANIYGRRVRQMKWRSFAVVNPGQALSAVDFPAPTLAQDVPTVFLFASYGVFRRTIEELDGYHLELTGTSLIRDVGLFGDFPPLKTLMAVWPISVILPSLTMLQIALYDLLSSFGLRPNVVMGHSAGETALLYASGAASKRMAMAVAVVRGRTMTLVENAGGGMAALSCAPYQADEIIQSAKESSEDGILEIACYNGPQAVAIAGHHTLVARAVEIATARGILARTIQTNVAVHSPMMDLCEESYRPEMVEAFARYGPCRAPSITTYSTATGALLEEFSPDYFWHNSRGPVRFAQTVRSVLRAHSTARFIEISPHAVLSLYLQELGVPPTSILCPMRRAKAYAAHQEQAVLLNAMGQLVTSGCNAIDFRAFNDSPFAMRDCDIPLPSYPLARKPIPFLPRHSKLLQQQLGPLVRPLSGDNLRVNHATHPELAQHVINQEPIMPASGFLEMVLEAGANIVWNVRFHSMFSLASNTPTALRMHIDGKHWRVVSSAVAGVQEDSADERKPQVHAEGFMTLDQYDVGQYHNSVPSDVLQCCKLHDADDLYSGFQYFAQYGPVFRRIRRCYFGSNYALVEIQGLDEPSQSNYVIHPALLDACLHVVVHPRFTSVSDTNVFYLPSALGSLVIERQNLLAPRLESTLYAYAVLTDWRPDEITADVHVIDVGGKDLCTLRDLKVARHYINTPTPPRRRFELIDQPLSMIPFDLGTEVDVGEEAVMKTLCASRVTAGQKGGSQIVNNTPCTSHCGVNILLVCAALHASRLGAMGKRVITVLGVDFKSGSLHGDAQALLQASLGRAITVVYHAAVMDEDMSQSHSIPVSCKTVDFSTRASRPHHPIFDIVLYNCSSPWSAPDVTTMVRACATSLIPGGFLFIQGVQSGSGNGSGPHPDPSGAAQVQTELSRLHFQTRARHLVAGLPTTLIEAHSSSLSFGPDQAWSDRGGRAHVLSYRIGDERSIQTALAKLDVNASICVWILARGERDGDAARGFTRSLRRELSAWDIGLLISAPTFDKQEVEQFARYLSSHRSMERELYIAEDRQLYVPRIREVPIGPPNPTIFHVADVRSGYVQLDPVFNYDVESEPRHHCLAGTIIAASNEDATALVGTRVVTITAKTSEVGAPMTVRRDSMIPIPDHWELHRAPLLALGCLVIRSVLGTEKISPRCAVDDARRIIVVGTDTPLGRVLTCILRQLCIGTVGLKLQASPLHFASLLLGPRDIVVDLSGHAASSIAATFVGRNGVRHIRMRDVSQLLCEATRSPQILTTMLQNAIQLIPSGVSIDSGTAQQVLHHPQTLFLKFSASDVYVLIGGIGSLGMHIALWMYERGARHILLTSRSGRQSLERAGDVLAIRILNYLESRADLSLRLVACDAASFHQMHMTLSGVAQRIAGCMLLSGVLVDRTFFSQDASTFEATFRPKLQAIKTLESVIPIKSLDFLVVFSSIASFGNTGQTNYASANTALEGYVRQYRNAFALITPAIVDSAAISSALRPQERESQIEHLMPWAFSAEELNNCIEDGILLLAREPVGVYVPNLKWDLVRQHLGPSLLYDYLADSNPRPAPSRTQQMSRDDLLFIVLQHVDVPADFFSPDAPLSRYGMDSLSAGRLAYALKNVVTVSSMQLLGGLSFAELHLRTTTSGIAQSGTADDQGEVTFNWLELSQSGRPLVKLVNRQGDTPLILVHGASGSIVSFMPLQQTFTSSLWVLQSTPDTPMHSLDAMAAYYYKAIKDAQPSGPYRIGAYSGSSIIPFLIAERIVKDGDVVAQFSLLDHFPLLFASPYLEPDDATVRQRTPSHAFMNSLLQSMLHMYRAEPSISRQQFTG
ncbi:uncharacterized protein C8Q71DRAFT_890608 [Rhodofomes roseus]|uniref:Acyl transferase domain-containing protein n=1 Tax=Rhodofomes roseus TaxID=34475 RepID=A0ABQ8KRK0_9APHY|nr:uncharacterized protein C8Q71DRAFT_890608 [Rhodofomes roseus]KAH9841048.1 hypothetical protein C8Q71DRAFT_890608 [Rhodofomes roseus]